MFCCYTSNYHTLSVILITDMATTISFTESDTLTTPLCYLTMSSNTPILVVATVGTVGGAIIGLSLFLIVFLCCFHQRSKRRRTQVRNLQRVITERQPSIRLTSVNTLAVNGNSRQAIGNTRYDEKHRLEEVHPVFDSEPGYAEVGKSYMSKSQLQRDHDNLPQITLSEVDSPYSEIVPLHLRQIHHPQCKPQSYLVPTKMADGTSAHTQQRPVEEGASAHTESSYSHRQRSQSSPFPDTTATEKEQQICEHVYAAVNKTLPLVPQKSKELVEYLEATRPRAYTAECITEHVRLNLESQFSSTTVPSSEFIEQIEALRSSQRAAKHQSSTPKGSPVKHTYSSSPPRDDAHHQASSPTLARHADQTSPHQMHSPSPTPIPGHQLHSTSSPGRGLSTSLPQHSPSMNWLSPIQCSPSNPAGQRSQTRNVSIHRQHSWSPQPVRSTYSSSSTEKSASLSPIISRLGPPTTLATLSKSLIGDMRTNVLYQSVETFSDQVYALPNIVRSASAQQLSPANGGCTESIQHSESRTSSRTYENSTPTYAIPISPTRHERKVKEVKATSIREIRKIGSGAFGDVVLAETIGLSPRDLGLGESEDQDKPILVAVKKLRNEAPHDVQETFKSEARFMSRLKHKNVISLIAVCKSGTPFLMLEYMENGDLNQFLQQYTTVVPSAVPPLNGTQIRRDTLLHMCTQIASGMEYLSSHNFVHRDLATRNCLVGQCNVIKIADFGLSKSLYNSHYYQAQGQSILPIRWMATECFYGKFSQESDVWAFGVTMWEIYTLAKTQPYSEKMTDEDIIRYAQRGKERILLSRPDHCPENIYIQVMLPCWRVDPNDRPTFLKLHATLSAMQSHS